LCGSTTKRLTRTSCCGNWICDDEDRYVLFSYARNSCHRNHDRYTLCSFHYNERHKGRWQDCEKCRENFRTETYVWYGTNEYNFEKLESPPSFEPTHCAECGRVIHLGTDGYTLHPGGTYSCEVCGAKMMRRLLASERQPQKKK
jgi:NAD-dependent SIR2 family protein deacetylase